MGILPKFIDNAAGKPAQAVGDTLTDLWKLGIGNHVSLWSRKQEFRHKQNFEDYVYKVQNKTQVIPEEFLKEPELNIVGPAIEASKFYIDSEQLREMFANLISSTIDSRKFSKVHPSFVEIIKQLSPLDAAILINFKQFQQLPAIRVDASKNDAGTYVVIQQHILNFKDQVDYKAQASSISNLQRVGLLAVDYSVRSGNPEYYDYISSHPVLEEANQRLIEIRDVDPEFTKLDFKKGICTKTPLCEDFIEICL
ncbi:DUF4393 domain-containing protein [Bacillus velezensis]|uniref:DUF4393 domain-containing protein n=1 Tax=Bacillus TaxID=1386 RepID=UPI00098826CE|nr:MULTISPECIES: DUF4393 domain-containing protein [Bacillus]AQS44026.1 hypothetical protein BVH55_08930 [Bacillus velezensis]MBT0953681.1 DUF4393 domain-containing protein [Bacillus velezensis]MCD7912878.1 DUF4393 domain-containing protein [Bacillus velezensis]MCQ9192634.1 DUF4393 domain-containing protein [Bacillus velezensis]MCX2915695.1 DUF4393 domain-containing protein [Bacillus velezensis]